METPKIELSASNMKSLLWDTLMQVKDGKMQPGQADSVATTAREILRTTTVQLKVAAQSNRPIPADVLNFAEK
ncbi:MAG: hypothetical protein JWP57_2041 [Spirosoma sp.]|nr:hypothetical protein [Spirosoma sp.]